MVAVTALNGSYWPLGLELARRAVADHPWGINPRTNLLIALLGNNRIDEAVQAADRDLAELSRLSSNGYALVALAHALHGDRDRALAIYDQLEATDAERADEGRADLALYEGRLDDAERFLQRQIDEARRAGDPQAARTEYCSMGWLSLRRGDLRRVRTLGRAALGGDFVVEYEAAYLLLQAGEEGPAATLARVAADRTKALSRLYGKLAEGDVLLHRGKLAGAREAFEAAGRIQDLWWVHARLGETALRDHRWEDAERELAATVARRGEVAITRPPSLQFLPPILEELARARAAAPRR